KKTFLKIERNSPQAIVLEGLVDETFELEALDSIIEQAFHQQQAALKITDSLKTMYWRNSNAIIHNREKSVHKKRHTAISFPAMTPVEVRMPGVPRVSHVPQNAILFKNGEDEARKVSTLVPKSNIAKPIYKKVIAPDTTNIFKAALKQAIVSSVVKDKPVSERVPKPVLDSLLKTEFAAKGIAIPYEFGVVKNANDSVIFSKTSDASALVHAPYKAALFSNDMLSSEPYSLLVNFPGQKAHIFESLWLMLASSLLFILITIFSFSFTIVALVKQKKISDIKTDFINNMTHEFKTPIATIGLASEALKEPKVLQNSDKLARFVNVIQDENKRLSKQVERVLQAAVIERGDLQLTFEDVNVHEAIEHVVHNIAVQVEAKGGKIECIFHAKNALLYADEVHISNVLYNLLDNANKYSPDAPDITISTRSNEHGVFISVSDRGMGMSREALKQIFEKFYRVPTGNLHDVKGFGLGLSYVKAIVEAHGGSIAVESELKKGSNFDVFLPYIHDAIV
ncbi:MAG TPA: HAMP domain-containing sensor histidine kinase, partial [Patescibacteria group bacterium]|nr:HAMP domain-containing sensor histidine kinase [Patescibacteria group bacterium]